LPERESENRDPAVSTHLDEGTANVFDGFVPRLEQDTDIKAAGNATHPTPISY